MYIRRTASHCVYVYKKNSKSQGRTMYHLTRQIT